MGTILQLNPAARASSPPLDDGEPIRCEIVIFPGVRIERRDPDAGDGRFAPTEQGGGDGGRRPRKSS